MMLNKKVFVDKTRYKSMLCYDWPMSMQEKLTTDPNATNIWVVSLNQVNFHNLEDLLARRPDCDRVIAFQPTGWSFPAASTKKATLNTNLEITIPTLIPRVKGKSKIFSVAYSEHSSFTELIEFIKTFRPLVVIPTVNCKEDQVKQQLSYLRDISGVYQ
jgi:hypothetical protein